MAPSNTTRPGAGTVPCACDPAAGVGTPTAAGNAPVTGRLHALELGAELPDVERMLDRHGQLGVLSISVLERQGRGADAGWDEYDAVLRCIAGFLGEYTARSMRSHDLLLEPAIAGNSFAVFLNPPRQGRPLDLMDLSQVRHRLGRSLNLHLWSSLPNSAIHRFGAYVGAALLHREPAVDTRRIVWRGLEAAFADALGQKHAEHRRQVVRLQRILRTGAIQTVYQPVVDVYERRVLGFEALTRVAAGRFPSPDLLFKLAHEQGALWKLERLSRSRALDGLPDLDGEQLLFLNLEPASIDDPELVGEGFLVALRGAGLRPERVVLELTEHTEVRDFPAFRENLSRCRDLGFRLAMDDVGAGYSGLQGIAEIRPDFLKLDMSIVRDLDRSEIKRALVATIADLAARTGGTLVAEGVERPEELAALLVAGVRCAQGYFFARPAQRPAAPDWLRIESLLPPVPAS